MCCHKRCCLTPCRILWLVLRIVASFFIRYLILTLFIIFLGAILINVVQPRITTGIHWFTNVTAVVNQTIATVDQTLIRISELGSPFLNNILAFSSSIAPAWNALANSTILLAKNILTGPFAASTATSTSTIFNDVLGFITTVVVSIRTNLQLIYDLIALGIEGIDAVYHVVGAIFCPNEVCPPALCIPNTSTCAWSIFTPAYFLINVVLWIASVGLWLVGYVIAFILDLLVFILTALGYAIPAFGYLDRSSIGPVLPTLPSPNAETIAGKNALTSIQTWILTTLRTIIDTFWLIVISGDTIACNVLMDPINCVITKVCYAFGTATITVCILKLPCTPVTLEFLNICYMFGFRRGICKCDRALWTQQTAVFIFAALSNQTPGNCRLKPLPATPRDVLIGLPGCVAVTYYTSDNPVIGKSPIAYAQSNCQCSYAASPGQSDYFYENTQGQDQSLVPLINPYWFPCRSYNFLSPDPACTTLAIWVPCLPWVGNCTTDTSILAWMFKVT